MRKTLDRLANRLFDFAEAEHVGWYLKPFQYVVTAFCFGIIVCCELRSGKPFFYGNVPHRNVKKGEDK